MAKYQWTIGCNNQNFTGKFWGIDFHNGIAKVDKKYYADLLTRKGCEILTRDVIDAEWNPSKILIIRLGAYGDNLMITTAIRGLRNKFPDASIHFYGNEPNHLILFNNPDLNSIVKAPIQDIGHMIDDYDEVYDLIEHIEHNPLSDYCNAYELAEERLEVIDFVKPWEHKPVFVPTQEEITQAKHILKSYNFDPDNNKLILIHAESSSIIRRISINTALKVSKHFIDKGYKIVFAGHDSATPNMEFQKCSHCKEMIVAEITGVVGISVSTACPHCQKNTTVTKTGNDKDIFFLHELLGRVSARIIFTMQMFMDLVIAVDSAHSHIAAAFDIPSVLLYGPIDPKLRDAKSYNKKRIINKPLKCGPCHQLSPYCVIYPKGPPPCMTQYIAKDIIQEAERALVGDFTIDDYNISSYDYISKDVRNCPVCDAHNFELISRKKSNFYIKCNDCKSIFLDSIPNLGKIYDKSYISYHEHNTDGYYKSFANTLDQVAKAHNIQGKKYLDVGCGEGYLLDHMEERGWHVNGIEKRRPTKQREKAIKVSLDDGDETYNLISLIHVIEHVEDPKIFFKSIIDKLDNDGVLFIYGHDASTYPNNNAWLPINTKVVGEHLQIMPREQIDKMLSDLGLIVLQSRTVNNVDFMITVGKGK